MHVGSVHGEHQRDMCNYRTGTKRGLKIHESRKHKPKAGLILGQNKQLQNENRSILSSTSNEEAKFATNSEIPSSHHEKTEDNQLILRDEVKVPAVGGDTRSNNNNNDLPLDKSFCSVQNCYEYALENCKFSLDKEL